MRSACASAAEGTGVTCGWDTTGVTPGTYYVYGITNDGTNSAVNDYSPGQITINNAPNTATLVVNQPDGAADTIAEGGSFTVNYDLSDSDDVTTVAFFYDTNNSGADGTAIASCAAEPEATGGTCVWNTSGVAPGSYYVYGTTSGDGAGATTVYSSGTMTINDAPALPISEPNGTGDTVAVGSVYNITYTLTDGDDTITAAFYYDTDAVGFNGTAITGACVALVDAFRYLQRKGLIQADPLQRMVASVSVGMVKGVPILDLDYPEDSSADTDMNVIMAEDGKFIEVQGTAEGETFSREELNAMLDLASAGIDQLIQVQKNALGSVT